jgi:uncharacterized RDD family membrane protein YckC
VHHLPVAARPHGHALAGPGRRLLARLVDLAALIGLNAVINGYFIYHWWSGYWPVVVEAFRQAQAGGTVDNSTLPTGSQGFEVAMILTGMALWAAYEIPAIAHTGQTPGKRLLRLKVLRVEEDAPPGVRRSITRWQPMGFAVPMWLCLIGFVLHFADSLRIVLDQNLHQAWHDRWAGTVVVAVEQTAATPEPGQGDVHGPTDPR